jgi:hypothetical protein
MIKLECVSYARKNLTVLPGNTIFKDITFYQFYQHTYGTNFCPMLILQTLYYLFCLIGYALNFMKQLFYIYVCYME